MFCDPLYEASVVTLTLSVIKVTYNVGQVTVVTYFELIKLVISLRPTNTEVGFDLTEHLKTGFSELLIFS